MIRTPVLILGLFLSATSLAQSWERVGLLGDDVILSTCVNPQGHLFVATKTVHRSTDKGVTWKQIALGIELRRNEFGPHLYSNADGTLFILTPAGLHRSTDNVDSWQRITEGGRYSIEFAVMPSGNLLHSRDSIYMSSDNGSSWRSVRSGEGGYVFADHDGVIYVYGTNGLYRSTDEGHTWSKIINGLSFAAEIKSVEPGKVYASTGSALYVSTDKGRVWTSFYQAPSTITGFFFFSTDTIVVGTSTAGVQITTDGGSTWNQDSKYGTPSEQAKGCFRFDNEICISLNKTIYKTFIAMPRVWKEVEVPSGIVGAVRVTRQNEVLASTEFKYDPGIAPLCTWWSYNGAHWEKRVEFHHISSGGVLQTIEIDSHDVLRGVLNHYFVSSTDGGSSWKTGIRFDGVGFRIGINQQFIYVSSNTQGVYRSSDNGETWDLMTNGLDEKGVSTVAAGPDGYAYTGRTLQYFRTADSAWTWQEVVFPFISGSGPITAIEAYGPNVIMGVDVTGVYFSTDFGLTWSNYSDGLPMVTINELVGTPSGSVFAATTGGLFEFDPTTKFWKDAGEITGHIASLTLGPDGRVYVGTSGDGVYRSTTTYGAWVMNIKLDLLSGDVSIFPNPASTKVQLSWRSRPHTYTITIYTLLGQSVLTMKNTDIIDISALQAGHYFVRIATDGHVVTLPLMVVR